MIISSIFKLSVVSLNYLIYYSLLMSDPYNWPFPSRKDLMNLSTINQKDVGLNKIKPINNENFKNRTDDIVGA